MRRVKIKINDGDEWQGWFHRWIADGGLYAVVEDSSGKIHKVYHGYVTFAYPGQSQ